jgi:hypothetical protein
MINFVLLLAHSVVLLFASAGLHMGDTTLAYEYVCLSIFSLDSFNLWRAYCNV